MPAKAKPKLKVRIPTPKPTRFHSTPKGKKGYNRKRALEMLLTGRPISADEAERYGLINKVVPADRLAKETLSLAKHIAQASPLTLSLGKKSFYSQIETDEARAYNYAKEMMSLNAMTEDAQEGISAFLQKRDPQWKGK